MSTVTAIGEDRRAGAEVTAADLREVLERTLRELNEDHRRGPLLRATGLRLRIEVRDLDLRLDVAAGDDGHDENLRWSFGGAGWEPKLELSMDSEVANGYLQGRESLAIAIARGKIRCHGDSRAALLYLPAVRLICEPYRRIVASDFPRLAIE